MKHHIDFMDKLQDDMAGNGRLGNISDVMGILVTIWEY